MSYPFGRGRHQGAPTSGFEDDVPTSQLWISPGGVDPDTEDETPTARFVLSAYRGLLDYAEDDAPTARFTLNPYRDLPVGREAHDPFGLFLDPDPGMVLRPGAVIEGEVVWRGRDPEPVVIDDEPDTELHYFPPAVPEPEPEVVEEPAAPVDGVEGIDDATDDVVVDDEPDEPLEHDEPGWEDLGPNTVGGAAELIVRELAPGEMTRFPVVVQRFFADEILQRRVVRWALSGAKRDDPVALQLGGGHSELVTALCLAMLTCAATGVLGNVGTRHHGGVTRWCRNRGAARRRLTRGPATTLPHLSSIGTATVGQIVEEAAEDAGLTPDRARRLSILILSALTRPAH